MIQLKNIMSIYLLHENRWKVRKENRIILFDNEHSMATFIKNAKFVNPDTELQPVTVECENYER